MDKAKPDPPDSAERLVRGLTTNDILWLMREPFPKPSVKLPIPPKSRRRLKPKHIRA